MAALLDIFLFQLEHLSVGNFDLLFHQVHSDHFFRYRMFYLQTGVHFEEVIIAMLVDQELNRACTDIVDRFGRGYRLFTHIFTQFGSHENRWRLFHNLLVAALYGTFAFAQVNHVSVFVAQNLKFNVMRFLHELLQINGIVAKRRK